MKGLLSFLGHLDRLMSWQLFWGLPLEHSSKAWPCATSRTEKSELQSRPAHSVGRLVPSRQAVVGTQEGVIPCLEVRAGFLEVERLEGLGRQE